MCSRMTTASPGGEATRPGPGTVCQGNRTVSSSRVLSFYHDIPRPDLQPFLMKKHCDRESGVRPAASSALIIAISFACFKTHLMDCDNKLSRSQTSPRPIRFCIVRLSQGLLRPEATLLFLRRELSALHVLDPDEASCSIRSGVPWISIVTLPSHSFLTQPVSGDGISISGCQIHRHPGKHRHPGGHRYRDDALSQHFQ